MLLLPLHDLPTRSASGFILRYIMPRSFPPQLVGPGDRKALFTTLNFGDLIVAVGHGGPSELAGHNNQTVMDTGSLPDVRGKVVFLVSCETAQQLGPSLVERGGASAFIGFNEDVLWVCDADAAAMPWNDELAQPVMMPIVDALNSLFDGRPAKDSFERLRRSFEERFSLEQDEFIASLIAWNRDSARLFGDGNSSIRERPPLALPFRFVPPPPIVLPLSET